VNICKQDILFQLKEAILKRLMWLLLLGMGSMAYAAPPVAEAPIKDFGTPATVSISASVFTKVPTSQTSGRMGVFLGVPSTNTGSIVGIVGNCTSTAIATTIRPVQYAPGTNSPLIPLREDVCLWLITTNATAENIHVQEVLQ
jgi:hypothetical protein